MIRHLERARKLRLPNSLFLTCPLVMLAAPMLPTLPGDLGQLGFAALLALVLLSAADGGCAAATLTGLAGALGLLGRAWLLHRTAECGIFQMLSDLPIGQSAMLPGLGAWLGWHFDDARRRAHQLEQRCDGHEILMEQLREESKQRAAACEHERGRREQEEAKRLELSSLFLNLQHLGRELSGNLEIRAVAQMVSEAAKKLLNTPGPRLFLLDEQTNELVEQTPQRSGNRRPADQGMLGWVVSHGQIITAEDVANIHSLAVLRGQDPVEWQACAPLVVGQRVLGVLAMETIDARTPEFERLLYMLANFSAVAINNSQLFQRVEHMARHDGLTGLMNQSALMGKLGDLLQHERSTSRPFGVIMSDLDHFKQFNDRYGHQVGDYVLSSVARLWKALVPVQAISGRYGGEEFVFVLPESDEASTIRQAECLRSALQEDRLQFEGTPLRVTASFGVATFPANGRSAAALFREADAALYAAKRAGRNRVCLATSGNGSLAGCAAEWTSSPSLGVAT
jgi:diguanylate cyclase (GGDEF)-like protein